MLPGSETARRTAAVHRGSDVTPKRNMAALVRARLLARSKEAREDFQLVLTRYAGERGGSKRSCPYSTKSCDFSLSALRRIQLEALCSQGRVWVGTRP